MLRKSLEKKVDYLRRDVELPSSWKTGTRQPVTGQKRGGKPAMVHQHSSTWEDEVRKKVKMTEEPLSSSFSSEEEEEEGDQDIFEDQEEWEEQEDQMMEL